MPAGESQRVRCHSRTLAQPTVISLGLCQSRVSCRITGEVKPIALPVRGVQRSGLDLAIVGGAGVAFVAGFLPWWGGAIDLVGSVSVSGWSAGFAAWAGTLLLTAAGVLLVLRRAPVSWPPIAVGPSTLVACVSAVGLLLVFVRWLTLHRQFGFGVELGARYGVYIALIAGVVEVAAAVVEIGTSGEWAPWSRPGRRRALG